MKKTKQQQNVISPTIQYNIRAASYADLPLWVDLYAGLLKDQHLPFQAGGPVCVENIVQDFIRDPNGIALMAISTTPGVYEGKVVGWVFAHCGPYPFSNEPIVSIRGWDVMPELRASGIGGALLKSAKVWAQGRARIFTIGVNIDSSSNPELAFNKLKKLGFQEFERTFYLDISK